jgi:uncharacterized protein YukE
MAKDPNKIVARYKRKVGAAGQDWNEGIQAYDGSPNADAAAAYQDWLTKCNSEQTKANYHNQSKISPQYWKDQSSKSQSSYTGSTSKSETKMSKMAPILAQMGTEARRAAKAAGGAPNNRIDAARAVSEKYGPQLRAARY